MSHRLLIALLCSLAVLGGLTSVPPPARACAIGCTPINLILTYLPGFSNWGPDKASGVVELVLAEGEARGRVTGLPSLGGEVYQLWLTNTRTDELLPFGSFNTDQAQRAQFRFIVNEDIPDRPWNLVFITVQPQPGGPPSDKRSIGAFFPGPDQKGNLPQELPNTGGDRPADWTAPAPPVVPPSAPLPTTLAPAASTASPPLVWLVGLGLLIGAVGFLTGWRLRGQRRL